MLFGPNDYDSNSEKSMFLFYFVFLTLKLMWERLSRFSFDGFKFRVWVWIVFYLEVSVGAILSPCFDWLVLVRVSKSVFKTFFVRLFIFLRWRYRVGATISLSLSLIWQEEAWFLYSILFRLKLVWKRQFTLDLTDSGSGFEIRFLFLSILSLAST